ncbi:hypothetical protein P4571_08120 [Niallia alba]|uniref:hypothetical protein n=1 Tax=Niallia alba TaxID=2729105 RepID=UPI002E1B58E6|nr:hypothetical protein [Niallia alba]
MKGSNNMDDNKCAFCKPKNPKTLVATKGYYVSAWSKIYINENDVRLGINVRGESDSSKSIEIFYCPICGRKFV